MVGGTRNPTLPLPSSCVAPSPKLACFPNDDSPTLTPGPSPRTVLQHPVLSFRYQKLASERLLASQLERGRGREAGEGAPGRGRGRRRRLRSAPSPRRHLSQDPPSPSPHLEDVCHQVWTRSQHVALGATGQTGPGRAGHSCCSRGPPSLGGGGWGWERVGPAGVPLIDVVCGSPFEK